MQINRVQLGLFLKENQREDEEPHLNIFIVSVRPNYRIHKVQREAQEWGKKTSTKKLHPPSTSKISMIRTTQLNINT